MVASGLSVPDDDEPKIPKEGRCSLCEAPYGNYGHNPEPVKKYEERCCDVCNATIVIPARLRIAQGGR